MLAPRPVANGLVEGSLAHAEVFAPLQHGLWRVSRCQLHCLGVIFKSSHPFFSQFDFFVFFSSFLKCQVEDSVSRHVVSSETHC